MVSIVMPAYNAETYIQQAIRSVLNQTYPHWELIIVNDGSTDDTATIISSFDDKRIKVIEQLNKGEAVARNKAFDFINGDIIAFLDSDDLFLPEHLELTVNFLRQNPQFHAVYTDGYYINSSGDLLKTLASRRRGPFEGDVFSEAVRGSDLFGPPICVVLSRDIVIQHKLKFDEAITIGPDWVFLMDYAAFGKFGYLDKKTCLYRLHDTNISIRVDLKRRSNELAKCRIRSIHMDRFTDCPLDVKVNVFYDLLVNLLNGQPGRQSSIINSPQFCDLPAAQKARLLRLMASWAIHSGVDEKAFILNLLQESKNLNPSDWRTQNLLITYRISQRLARWILQVSKWGEVNPSTVQPFSDIDIFPVTNS